MDRAHSHYLKVAEGIEIHYYEKGQGDPIIFIPGLTFCGEIFQEQLNYFSSKYRAIAIDPRSQGLSTKTLHGNDYTTHGKDLAKLIEALELDQITLVGWSTGNLNVWSYLQQFGISKIKAVITIDMSPLPMSPDPEDWTEGSMEDLKAVATQFLTTPEGTRAFFKEYAEEVMLENPTEEQVEQVLDYSARTPYYVCNLLFSNAMFSDYRETASMVSENLRSLNFVAHHWAEVAVPFMEKLCPKTQNIVMGGHLMFFEHPYQWNNAVDKFLEELY